jgi:parallel beta-helix repeat protein
VRSRVVFGLVAIGLVLILLGVLVLVFYARPVGVVPAKTITVPDDFKTIQAAVDTASSGDTVFVKQGRYFENVVVNKTVSLVGENAQSTIIEGALVGNVVNVTTDYVNVTGFTLRENLLVHLPGGVGVELQNVEHCSVYGNNIVHDGVGVAVYGPYNSVVRNNISDNNGEGVVLSSFNSTVSDNTIASNAGGGIGCVASSLCNISRNSVLDNVFEGITLVEYSDNDTVVGNTVARNRVGVLVSSSSVNNSVLGNSISMNTEFGVEVSNSSDNLFCHNNFINNSVQVKIDGSENVWDLGYPSGGNYWSDYAGKYPNATEVDSSGFWNTPYAIDANNIDYQPRVKPASAT